MNSLALLIIVTCIAGVGSAVIGASAAAALGTKSSKRMALAIGFAAGLMLAIIVFDFIPEALELDETISHYLVVIAVIAAGMIVVAICNRIMESRMEKKLHCCAIDDPDLAQVIDEQTKSRHMKLHEEHEHEEEHHNHPHSAGISYKNQAKPTLLLACCVMAIAIALHNLPAGISIGASFASPDTEMIKSGITIAILIGIHSIPESMAMVIPLRYGDMSTPKTIAVAAAVGFVTVIGAVVGYALGNIGDFWLSMALAFASGAMLYVLFGEMIPEALEAFHSKAPVYAITVGLLFGLILIVAL